LFFFSLISSYYFIFSTGVITHTEAETLIERLKHTLDDTVHERDQLIKNQANANKKVLINTKTNRILVFCFRLKNMKMILMVIQMKIVYYINKYKNLKNN
jgi:hypothetical protein